MAAQLPSLKPLPPPAVSALRDEAAQLHRPLDMARTASEDFREERKDLQEAAEHGHNVILDLNINGTVRFVSQSWLEVIGTEPDEVQGKPIADLLLENHTAFADAVEKLRTDDSRSQMIRFEVKLSSHSYFRKKSMRASLMLSEGLDEALAASHDQTLTLEGQGIMVYDRTSGGESHTMWMLRPYIVREVTIDLPEVIVESLGVGAEVLARYLTDLAEAGVQDTAQHPPPVPILCRICERQITPWWFEKHTELCLQEHKAEMDVQLAQENLNDHRSSIVKVLDALEAQARPSRATSSEMPPPPPPLPEYKGMTIGPMSGSSSGVQSGRASPSHPPSQSKDRSTGSMGHSRGRSFAVRRPVARIVELVLDLCDTALEISTPALKDSRSQVPGEIRTQSPQSESRIAQVLQWQPPGTASVENEQGLAVLCDDTGKSARAKVEAVIRHRRILEYTERIRNEFEYLVDECIQAAMEKASRIAAGEISDSSEDTPGPESEVEPDDAEETPLARPVGDLSPEEMMFPASFEGSSAMAAALRNIADSEHTFDSRRRESSVAASTRSSSPRGTQTPRSYVGTTNISLSKRHSIAFESDAGADSDSSLRSSALSLARRADSPGSEASQQRMNAHERKRRSLILPSVMSSRSHSPARALGMPPPPHSPLRMTKSRIPSGTEGSQSPMTSPVLTMSEFSSPALLPQHLQNYHHRRQSSAASSEVFRPQLSPRLMPVTSNPQPRAVAPSIKDFEIIKPISKGAFGSVYLARKRSTGDYYAIKTLKKADMIAKNQVTNVKAERAIMMWQGESDFVAKLYYTFANKEYLFLVMEYLNGGDCASLVKILGGLSEDWAKRYVAEVVMGVQHLHSRGIVHRDLKPDNLLIDQKGHLKLTDFGLSRMGLVGRQKRVLNHKDSEPQPIYDLMRQTSVPRAVSGTSTRSTSFDLQGLQMQHSPAGTPSMTPAPVQDIPQPSYFNLNRDLSRSQSSLHRSDSENSEALQTMLRKFSLVEEPSHMPATYSPVEEEVGSEDASPDVYQLHQTINHSETLRSDTPPQPAMQPPTLALFDPKDNNRRFVGTPDYLAPETVNGAGQDEVSDWWSVGCMMFEFLYGYPPFHADTPDQVFENILARKIDWPPEEACPVSQEARNLMEKLMCSDPGKRLGANADDNFANGGDEIRDHCWLKEINWDSLRDDEASFVPAPENPEDTEYFDARGATLQNLNAEFEDQPSPAGTPGNDYPERPHDALSRVRNQINSIKRNLMPLSIPAHVRDGRTRRLSEPVAADDFGTFSFKNLPVLEKANKDVIQKLRAEALNKTSSQVSSPAVTSASPSLDSSPVLPMPLKRTLSSTKSGRPASPSLFTQLANTPSRASQPSSPLLVQFSTGQHSERRKTSSGSSNLSHQSSNSLQPGSFFESQRLPNLKTANSVASSPVKLAKSPSQPTASHERSLSMSRQLHSSQSMGKSASVRVRSQTISSQEGDDSIVYPLPHHHKRRSQVFDISPSSSDTEEGRQKAALLRVQRRRQSSRRLSQIVMMDGNFHRSLDVLVCEDHPVSRLVMERLLEKLSCRAIIAQSGDEAMRFAMSEVKFDIILTEYKLPKINGADLARMIRDTSNANKTTPIVCVTGYLKELPPSHHFDNLMIKPPTIAKLTDTFGRFCQWKPKQAGQTAQPFSYPPVPFSSLRQQGAPFSQHSPVSTSSSHGPVMPASSYRGSSRQDSVSSSLFADPSESGSLPKPLPEDWHEHELNRAFDGLGISNDPDPVRAPRSIVQIASLVHQSSAPPKLEHTQSQKPAPPHERSSSRRRSGEKSRLESAESGDDEDDELGNLQVRARSPRNRPRGTSKLGTEMMRTNSQGSVISIEDVAAPPELKSAPLTTCPSIDEVTEVVGQTITPSSLAIDPTTVEGGLTPPVLLPPVPGGASKVIDMDANEPGRSPLDTSPEGPTPRQSSIVGFPNFDLNVVPLAETPSVSPRGSPDPDPTPRPSHSDAYISDDGPTPRPSMSGEERGSPT